MGKSSGPLPNSFLLSRPDLGSLEQPSFSVSSFVRDDAGLPPLTLEVLVVPARALQDRAAHRRDSSPARSRRGVLGGGAGLAACM